MLAVEIHSFHTDSLLLIFLDNLLIVTNRMRIGGKRSSGSFFATVQGNADLIIHPLINEVSIVVTEDPTITLPPTTFSIYNAAAVTVTPVTLTEGVATPIPVLNTTYDVFYNLDTVIENGLMEAVPRAVPLTLSCSISGSSTLTYTLVPGDANPVPAWVTLDLANSKLDVLPPYHATTSVYTVAVQLVVDGDTTRLFKKLVKLEVLASTIPVPAPTPAVSPGGQSNA